MKTHILLLLTVMLLPSCHKDREQSVEEAARSEVQFPKLDPELPAENTFLSKPGPKRGICTLFQIDEMPLFLGPGVSWCYNWGHNPLKSTTKSLLDDTKMTFVPMVWSTSYNVEDLIVHQQNGCGYVLGYNEPNLLDQARLTPAQAASRWGDLVATAKSLGLKVVGPAVNYGTLPGYGDPTVWYDEFLAQPGVNLDDIDAIALHAYMNSGNAVKQLMIRKFAKYGKPLWLTEFANGEARTAAQQAEFLQECVTYLEADPAVERYAWFMDTITYPEAPHFPLVTGPQLHTSTTAKVTDLGILYTYISSFDKETWYPMDMNIPAESYSGQVEEESAAGNGWGPMVHTRVTTDMLGTLEIYDLSPSTWVEYQIDVPKTGKYRLDLRYSNASGALLTATFPGAPDGIFDLAATGNGKWQTSGFEVVLNKGKQTVRFSCLEGTTALNWLRFTSPK